MDNTIGVVIARCQVPDLHPGHKAVLASVVSRHRRIIVMLGVSAIPSTVSNPLDYQTRVQMLMQHVPDAVFYPLRDMPGDNAGWSKSVDGALHTLFPTGTFALYGGPDSFLPAYSGRWPKVELDMVRETLGGTQLRALCAAQPVDSPVFRAGVIYGAINRFQPVHSVIDLAIIKHDIDCTADRPCSPMVLMGRKSSEGGAGYRFVGGFADHFDASLESAAAREGSEETGALSFSSPIYVGSRKIPDRRYIGTGQSVITSMFYSIYVSGYPRATDDMAEIAWVPMHDIPTRVIDIHKPLATMLRDYLYSTHADALHEGVK